MPTTEHTTTAASRGTSRWLGPALAAVGLLALGGCVVAPPGYYGAAPAPAYATAYPAPYPGYGYYAAPPVGVVIGGGWGGGWGWRH